MPAKAADLLGRRMHDVKRSTVRRFRSVAIDYETGMKLIGNQTPGRSKGVPKGI